ncbi:rRNA maturation RNase YbeY [Candidatus Erwinia haradaeae]|uniref:Endoribonuclease YbeY n=1 Tax=Candidatus Erwinia haradaeae TaxID=1922217 RepID=A0A451DA67_9GAMM|nr:rRNA maturation RNase YbeY [Candidatus Erwinia haradaeae]VFP83132.1 Endoribonuclease YbeY [Candidatus Erwinia haradaeae]
MILDLQVACQNKQGLPIKADFLRWIKAAIPAHHQKKEITIRLVDEDEMQRLNVTFCKKDRPTNILSFPFRSPPHLKLLLLGDVIICRQIVECEAIEQQKSLESHWAHMVIHGILHLLGYDHYSKSSAEEMESIEKKIMLALGYTDPYLICQEFMQ